MRAVSSHPLVKLQILKPEIRQIPGDVLGVKQDLNVTEIFFLLYLISEKVKKSAVPQHRILKRKPPLLPFFFFHKLRGAECISVLFIGEDQGKNT